MLHSFPHYTLFIFADCILSIAIKISKILMLRINPSPLISLFSLSPISNIRKDSAYAGNLCFLLYSLAHSLVLISITEKQNKENIYHLGTNELHMSEVNLHFPLKFLLPCSFLLEDFWDSRVCRRKLLGFTALVM